MSRFTSPHCNHEAQPPLARRIASQASGLAAAFVFLCCGVSVAHSDDMPIRGVVKAVNQASVSTDVPMRVSRLAFREGQRFTKGDRIVQFDCRRQAGEFEAAKGMAREAELTVTANESLDRYNAVGKLDVDIARARLEKARGELKVIKARIEDCELVAPFDGRIAELSVRELEFTSPQRPYLTIIEDGAFELEMIASAAQVTRLQAGQRVRMTIDELPQAEIWADVRFAAPVIEPVSKTGKVIATIIAPPPMLSVGMSGTVVIVNDK